MKSSLLIGAILVFSAGTAWAGGGNGLAGTERDIEEIFSKPSSESIPIIGGLGLGVQYRYWQAEISGEFSANDPGLLGTPISVESDVGLDDSEPFNHISAWVSIPIIGSLRASTWFGTFEGDETLTQSIDFNGATFAVSTNVEAELELDVSTLVLEIGLPIPDLPKLGIDIGVQVGAKYVVARGALRGQGPIGNPIEEEEKVRGAMPVVGARVGVKLFDLLSAELEVQGLAWEDDDVELRIIDATLEAVLTPFEGIFVGLGYHLVELFGRDESGQFAEIEGDLTIDGFYLTAGYSF